MPLCCLRIIQIPACGNTKQSWDLEAGDMEPAFPARRGIGAEALNHSLNFVLNCEAAQRVEGIASQHRYSRSVLVNGRRFLQHSKASCTYLNVHTYIYIYIHICNIQVLRIHIWLMCIRAHIYIYGCSPAGSVVCRWLF